MTPTNPTQSKLNLLKAILTQFRNSDLFSLEEKLKLMAPIRAQLRELVIEMAMHDLNTTLEKINNRKLAPTE